MRRRLLTLVTLILVLSMVACTTQTPVAKDSGVYAPGEYTASARGMIGDVVLKVTFDENSIASIEVIEHHETEGIGTVAIEKLPAKIIESQSLVDSVSGATITSDAILAAVEDCVKQAGGNVEALKTKSSESNAQQLADEKTQVLVIGAGGAGMTAAVWAKESGAEVILIEKTAVTGGCTALSGGIFLRPQMEGDPEGMDKEELYQFFMDSSKGIADPDFVRTYVEKSPEAFKWVFDDSGYELIKYRLIPDTLLAYRALEGGVALGEILASKIEDAEVDLRLENEATNLIVDNGKVVGAVVKTAEGSTYNIYADAVVVATGGFANSDEMLAKYSSPEAAKYVIKNASAGSMGDGIRMCEEIGAKVVFYENWDTCGCFIDAGFYMDIEAIERTDIFASLIINDKGERFMREDENFPQAFDKMRQQLENNDVEKFFMIVNASQCTWIEDSVAQETAFKADTLEDLAAQMNVPMETFVSTFESYNALAGQEDAQFGKEQQYMVKIDTEGPFYATELLMMRTTTLDGIWTDSQARVFDVDNNVIPGLYAAGELCTAPLFGAVYASCGSCVGNAITFGMIAGQNAATYSAAN
ncbi:MAG: FAD-dependent oxidoreductase [Christensenellales bacterium]|jgi:succinate dehydrogenase/fumarate reductase flavoprotein subunit/uncharacterized protein with FMN-binding domain